MTHCLQIRPQRQNETDKECHSFSLIYANGERSLDLVIFVIYTRCIYIYIYICILFSYVHGLAYLFFNYRYARTRHRLLLGLLA